MEVVRRQRCAQGSESSYLMQANNGKDDGAGNQNQCLDEIGIDDRCETARDGINSRGNNQNDGRGHWAPSHHAFQHNSSSI